MSASILPSLVLEAAGSFSVNVLTDGRVRITMSDVRMEEQAPPMDLRQCAAWLKTTPRNVRAYVDKKQNPIPSVKVGGQLRFHVADVEAWMQREKIIGQRVKQRRASHSI